MAPAYRRIAARLRSGIDRGRLAEGERLPSVRKLAAIEGVSPPTAEQALRRLEAAGLIVSRPRSGFYVAKVKNSQPRSGAAKARPRPVTLTSEVHDLFAHIRSPGTVALGTASPSPAWLPTSALKRSIMGAQRRLGTQANTYSVPPGRLELRRQFADRARRWGCLAAPEEFIVTHGQTQALQLALRAVCRRGDIVAIESPCYFGTLMQLRSQGLRAIEIATDPMTGMDLRALRLAISTCNVSAVIVNPTANNPMGFTMSVADKRALVRMLQRAGIPLIEDDVYGDLSAGSPRAPACKAFDDTGNVLYCSSVSKTLAPGWRVGCIAPGRFFDSVLDLRVEASLAGTPVFELAVADLLRSGDYDRHLRRFRRNTADSMRSIASRIAATWPHDTRLTRPADGYLLWVELPVGVDAMALCEAAREERISVCPGSMFSAGGSGYRNYVRINCALPATPALLAAVDRIGALASAMLEPARTLRGGARIGIVLPA